MIAIKKKQELNNLLTKGLFINNSEMEIEKYQNEPKREIVVLSKIFSSQLIFLLEKNGLCIKTFLILSNFCKMWVIKISIGIYMTVVVELHILPKL